MTKQMHQRGRVHLASNSCYIEASGKYLSNGWIATDKHLEDCLTSFQHSQGFVTRPEETAKRDSHY